MSDACPCKHPRLCLLCGASEPCSLPGPDGTAPICQMDPPTYAELLDKLRGAYDQAAVLRAHVQELEADRVRLNWLDSTSRDHHTWRVVDGNLMCSEGRSWGTLWVREAIDQARAAGSNDDDGG